MFQKGLDIWVGIGYSLGKMKLIKEQYPAGTDLLWMAHYRKDPDGGDMDGPSRKLDGDAVTAMVKAQRFAEEQGYILQCLKRRY